MEYHSTPTKQDWRLWAHPNVLNKLQCFKDDIISKICFNILEYHSEIQKAMDSIPETGVDAPDDTSFLFLGIFSTILFLYMGCTSISRKKKEKIWGFILGVSIIYHFFFDLISDHHYVILLSETLELKQNLSFIHNFIPEYLDPVKITLSLVASILVTILSEAVAFLVFLGLFLAWCLSLLSNGTSIGNPFWILAISFLILVIIYGMFSTTIKLVVIEILYSFTCAYFISLNCVAFFMNSNRINELFQITDSSTQIIKILWERVKKSRVIYFFVLVFLLFYYFQKYGFYRVLK